MKNPSELYELIEKSQTEFLNKVNSIEQLSQHLCNRLAKLESLQKTLEENLLRIETGIEEVLHTLDAEQSVSTSSFGIEHIDVEFIKKSELN